MESRKPADRDGNPSNTVRAYTYIHRVHVVHNGIPNDPPADNPCTDHKYGDVCGYCGFGCNS